VLCPDVVSLSPKLEERIISLTLARMAREPETTRKRGRADSNRHCSGTAARPACDFLAPFRWYHFHRQLRRCFYCCCNLND
jgi:hypothetical protein